MESEAQIRVLKSLPELEEIRPFWESWLGNRDSDLDFYLTVLQSNPRILRPHVIVIYRGGRPDAMLVGRIDHREITIRVGYLRIRPKAKIVFFVYGALRGNASRENCELFVQEIRKPLSEGAADLAYLNFLQPDSHLYRFAKNIPGFLSRDHIGISQKHYTTALPGSAEEFYRNLSSNARWQARSKQKKLTKAFGDKIRIRCFRELRELDSLIHDAELVAKKTYQRGLGVGFADTPEERERLQLKARKGWLRGYVLYLADRPAAFWIGDINQRIFGSDFLGFDPEFEKYSPGMYLILKVIEGFCEGNGEKASGVDFATGHAQYKEVLSSSVLTETSVYIFAQSFKGLAINVVNTVALATDKALKQVLERTGFLQKVKKAWRGRLRRGDRSSEVPRPPSAE